MTISRGAVVWRDGEILAEARPRQLGRATGDFPMTGQSGRYQFEAGKEAPAMSARLRNRWLISPPSCGRPCGRCRGPANGALRAGHVGRHARPGRWLAIKRADRCGRSYPPAAGRKRLSSAAGCVASAWDAGVRHRRVRPCARAGRRSSDRRAASGCGRSPGGAGGGRGGNALRNGRSCARCSSDTR